MCSSLPWAMIAGPTVLTVTNGNGAFARCTSSKKMNWSIAGRPWPPYSTGQPMPEPAVGAELLHDTPELVGALSGVADALADVVGEQRIEVGPQLGAQRLLLVGLGQVHAATVVTPADF